MNDQVGAYILLYGLVGIIGSAAWWLGERGERKHREHQRKLHSSFNIIMNMGTGETREETLARTEAFEAKYLRTK